MLIPPLFYSFWSHTGDAFRAVQDCTQTRHLLCPLVADVCIADHISERLSINT